MMRRLLPTLVLTFALGIYLSGHNHSVDKAPVEESEAAAVPAALPQGAADTAEEDALSADAQAIPVFFPKANVVAKVADPVDAGRRQRVIETVETGMKEPYVRVERVFERRNGGARQVGGEIAMVANQVLLEKPEALDRATFERLLRSAGANKVEPVGDAFLATFTAQPADPRALDTIMNRVKEVAGAEVTVEPNYLRKVF